MEKKYKVVTVIWAKNLEDKLNEFDNEGWEIISVAPSAASGRYRIVLKNKQK